MTFGVVGPVAMLRGRGVVGGVGRIHRVDEVQDFVRGDRGALVLLTTTLKVVTVAVKPRMPLSVALPTSTFNAR